MPFDSFLFYVVEINDSQGCGGRTECDSPRNLKAHHQDSEALIGIVSQQVLDTRSHVHEVIRAQGMRLVPILQSAGALENKINLFFAIGQNTSTPTLSVH